VPKAWVKVAATVSAPPWPNMSIGSPQWGQPKALMFSMTPATFCLVCTASIPARTATSAAACCGVVTTMSSLLGSSCTDEIATSPVPGGRSNSRTSRSPHHTSVRNCSNARCSIGPRKATGSAEPPGLNGSIEIARTPCFSGGNSIPSTTVGARSRPSIRGTEWP